MRALPQVLRIALKRRASIDRYYCRQYGGAAPWLGPTPLRFIWSRALRRFTMAKKAKKKAKKKSSKKAGKKKARRSRAM
jgi:hypothetical protein